MGTGTRNIASNWQQGYNELKSRLNDFDKVQTKLSKDLKKVIDDGCVSGNATCDSQELEASISNFQGDIDGIRDSIKEMREKAKTFDDRFASLEKCITDLRARTSDSEMEQWFHRKMEMMMGKIPSSQMTAAEALSRNNIVDENALVNDPSYKDLVGR